MTEKKVPTIALCVIVKNGARTIRAMLESAAPHFDEIVIVDTGSTDDTMHEALAALKLGEGWQETTLASWAKLPYGHTLRLHADLRITLARFEWIKDFAAARNFSFDLATSEWRGYLDHDDKLVFAPGGSMRKTLAQLKPEVNALTFPYVYFEGDTEQDVVRFVRWADGYRWRDPIHESLERTTGPRIDAKLIDARVEHSKTDEEVQAAWLRNREIIQKTYDEAQPGSPLRGRMAFHRIADCLQQGLLDEARKFCVEVIGCLPDTNLAAYARAELARIALQQQDGPRALAEAGTFVASHGSSLDAWVTLGIVQSALGLWDAADATFRRADELRAAEAHGRRRTSVRDVWWTDGLAGIDAALAALHCGRVEEALQRFTALPATAQHHPNTQSHYLDARKEIGIAVGLHRLHAWSEFLIWSCEPRHALDLFYDLPATLAEVPAAHDMKRALDAKLRHLRSWAQYKAAYASIPDEQFHTALAAREAVLQLGRAQGLLAWVKRQPQTKPLHVCSIGFQDGVLEGAALDAHPLMELTVCDVGPQASVGFAELAARYPGRVYRHEIERHHYDWPRRADGFDAIVLFEVIEHVPSARKALIMICNRLREGGTLLLSTPIADRWIESYLTDGRTQPAPTWYGHVRGYGVHSLWADLITAGLHGRIWTTDGQQLFYAEAQRRAQPPPDPSVSRYDTFQPLPFRIYVPGTPTPFDADSADEGFLGGSEEAVIRLAKALSALGHRVEVYAPTRVREDGRTLVADGNVLWLPLDEFDLASDHDEVTTLFWRCPEIARSPAFRAGKYRKVLWLHDAAYGATPGDYAAFDHVLVLSEHHLRTLKRLDKLTTDAGNGNDAKVVLFGNGLDPYSFPIVPTGPRDPHKVIYASSPDRGLHRLLEVWPQIRASVPDATLDIYYSWATARHFHPELIADLEAKLVELKEQGVCYLGGVSQPVLHDAMLCAGVWAYPNTGDVETYCITAIKALYAGMRVVCSDAGALPEVTQLDGHSYATLIDEDTLDTDEGLTAFTVEVIKALQFGPVEDLPVLRDRLCKLRSWEAAAKQLVALVPKDEDSDDDVATH